MHSKQNLPKYTFPFFNFSFSKHVICCLKTAFTIFFYGYRYILRSFIEALPNCSSFACISQNSE